MRISTTGALAALSFMLTLPVAAQTVTPPPAAQAPATLQAPTQAADDLSLDQVIEKYLEARGGVEKWKSIQTQKMTGVALIQGFEMPLAVYAKRPNAARQELTLEVPGQPAVTIVNLFDGTRAWTINPLSGSPAPQEMPAAQTATARMQSDFDGALIDSQAKGYTVTLLDPVTIASKKVLLLRVAKAGEPTQHFYLDPVTFVELRVTTDGENASETDLSDYKDIDGIMVPHGIVIRQGGAIQATLKILTVEFNVPLDDALFRVQ